MWKPHKLEKNKFPTIFLVAFLMLSMFSVIAVQPVNAHIWYDFKIFVVGNSSGRAYVKYYYWDPLDEAFEKWVASYGANIKVSPYTDLPTEWVNVDADDPAELVSWQVQNEELLSRNNLFLVYWCKKYSGRTVWHEGDGFIKGGGQDSYSYVYQLNEKTGRQTPQQMKKSLFHELGKRMFMDGGCWWPYCGMLGGDYNRPNRLGHLCSVRYGSHGCRQEWFTNRRYIWGY